MLKVLFSINFQIIPNDYLSSGNLHIRIIDRSALRTLQSNSEVSFKQSSYGETLLIPWMDGAKYPLSVWFFAVRDLFKRPLPSGQPWSSSVSLADEFCIGTVINAQLLLLLFIHYCSRVVS
jgi:hypothetical protein